MSGFIFSYILLSTKSLKQFISFVFSLLHLYQTKLTCKKRRKVAVLHAEKSVHIYAKARLHGATVIAIATKLSLCANVFISMQTIRLFRPESYSGRSANFALNDRSKKYSCLRRAMNPEPLM